MTHKERRTTKLEVPDPKDQEGINWRLKLITIAGQGTAQSLAKAIQAEEALDGKKRLSLVRRDNAFFPDELDLAELLAGKLFIVAANGKTEAVIAISPTASTIKWISGNNVRFSEEQINEFRAEIKRIGKQLFKDAALRIRAMYAGVELLAMRLGVSFLPD